MTLPSVSSSPSHGSRATFTSQLREWLKHGGSRRNFSLIMMGIALLASLATYHVFSQTGLLSDKPLDILLNIDFIIILIWAVLIARRIYKLWIERRKGRAGSKLHIRLAILFSGLTITPTIVVTILSAVFFHMGVQSWFSNRVNTALKESTTVAEAYLLEHKKVIRSTVEFMAWDLILQLRGQETSTEQLDRILDVYTNVRSLDEAIVFTPDNTILGRSRLSFSLQFEHIPEDKLKQARTEVVILTTGKDRVRALIKIPQNEDAYLLVGRFIDPKIQERIEQVQSAVSEYHVLESKRSGLEFKFSLIFIMFTLFLLMISIWIGLLFATKLIEPLSQLIEVADRVSSGDLTAQVKENQGQDEISVLSRTFNRMTAEIKQQHGALIIANQQLDSRRQFIEDVLAGVSAGIIGLTADGAIQLTNRSADNMLVIDHTHNTNQILSDIIPEFKELLEQAKSSKESIVHSQISITRKGITRTLLVRVGVEHRDQKELVGFIVTFDDITGLVQAQRKAAWSDVARRIAHEIKNPLTPISLSAERLRRRYQKYIPTEDESFRTCIDTIIRQVDHIGRMVGEFSAFARMPTPRMATENLCKLARETLFLQQTVHQDIHFHFQSVRDPLTVHCDASQMSQVFTNLLQNSIDALQSRHLRLIKENITDYETSQIWIHLSLSSQYLKIIFEDNGEGFPLEERYSILEPYITNKSKGTGLGLAIVKKIVEDHLGSVVLGDRQGGGAQIQLIFPNTMLIDEYV